MQETNNRLIFGTGMSSEKTYDAFFPLFKESIQNGIYSFDTAPSYHMEEIIGKCIKNVALDIGIQRDKLWLQTKIDAWQMQEKKGDIQVYVEQVLKKMGLEYLDALLIHWPIPDYLESTWQAFIKLQSEGIVKHIGICNFKMRQLKKAITWDTPPEIIQIERHPLNICSEEVAFCREHEIKVQAYSALCKMDNRILNNRDLNDIAQFYKKNVGQIVMRWHLDTGVMPIFTSKKTSRIHEYADIFDFSLIKNDIERINAINQNYKMYLESWACPGY